MKSMQCISKDDYDVTLRGQYWGDVFDFIEIKLQLCDGSSGIECASPLEIEDYFKQKKTKFRISFTNDIIDPKSKDTS